MKQQKIIKRRGKEGREKGGVRDVTGRDMMRRSIEKIMEKRINREEGNIRREIMGVGSRTEIDLMRQMREKIMEKNRESREHERRKGGREGNGKRNENNEKWEMEKTE